METEKAKNKHASTNKQTLNRLSRIEGQVRGVRRMVEEGAYCIDIITQIQAVQAALGAVSRNIMRTHLETCVVDAMRGSSEANTQEKIDEIMDVLRRKRG